MNYKVEKGTEHLIHVELHVKQFDVHTGKPLYKPYVHTSTERDFEQFCEFPHDKTINKILHLPKGYELPMRTIRVMEKNKRVTKKVPFEILEEHYKKPRAAKA